LSEPTFVVTELDDIDENYGQCGERKVGEGGKGCPFEMEVWNFYIPICAIIEANFQLGGGGEGEI
jgi:hypothetical protein